MYTAAYTPLYTVFRQSKVAIPLRKSQLLEALIWFKP